MRKSPAERLSVSERLDNFIGGANKVLFESRFAMKRMSNILNEAALMTNTIDKQGRATKVASFLRGRERLNDYEGKFTAGFLQKVTTIPGFSAENARFLGMVISAYNAERFSKNHIDYFSRWVKSEPIKEIFENKTYGDHVLGAYVESQFDAIVTPDSKGNLHSKRALLLDNLLTRKLTSEKSVKYIEELTNRTLRLWEIQQLIKHEIIPKIAKEVDRELIYERDYPDPNMAPKDYRKKLAFYNEILKKIEHPSTKKVTV